jgi:hypothetical protein
VWPMEMLVMVMVMMMVVVVAAVAMVAVTVSVAVVVGGSNYKRVRDAWLMFGDHWRAGRRLLSLVCRLVAVTVVVAQPGQSRPSRRRTLSGRDKTIFCSPLAAGPLGAREPELQADRQGHCEFVCVCAVLGALASVGLVGRAARHTSWCNLG